MLDGHISSVIQTRKASILGCEFIVTKNGVEQENLTQILKSKWFSDFVDISLDSMYFGFSLIEFDNIIDNGFKYVESYEREYVKPEFGIVGETYSDLTGLCYLDKPYNDWMILVGGNKDLGLLTKAAPYYLWKVGAISAYAEYAEMAGVPIRIMKSDAFDETTRSMSENFMRNLGSSAYAVIGLDESVEFGESKNPAGASEMFNGLIDKCNEELSKLILGGTGMVDSKAFVGSSEIHQQNFLLVVAQDKKFIENVCNYQLIPLLNRHGFGFEGCKIEVAPDEELNLKEKFEMVKGLMDKYYIPSEYIRETFNIEVYDKIEEVESVSSGTTSTQVIL